MLLQLIKYIFYLLYKLISRRKILKVTVQSYIFISKDMRNDFLFQVLFWTLYIKWLILVLYQNWHIQKIIILLHTQLFTPKQLQLVFRQCNWIFFAAIIIIIVIIDFVINWIFLTDISMYCCAQCYVKFWCKTNKNIDTTMVVVRG